MLELEGIDFGNVDSTVKADSERGFIWQLQPKKLHQLPPSATGKHFDISYMVDVEVRFSGAVLPLRFSLPFHLHQYVGDMLEVL